MANNTAKHIFSNHKSAFHITFHFQTYGDYCCRMRAILLILSLVKDSFLNPFVYNAEADSQLRLIRIRLFRVKR